MDNLMNIAAVSAALAIAVSGAGCTNLERSRNVSDPAVPGKVLALQVCSNCHGADGNSVSPNFPRLAGQTEAYLVEQLTSFRARGRSDPAGFVYMWGLSKNLTDKQIQELAAYFAGEAPAAISFPTGKTSLVERGKALYTGGLPEKNIPPCTVCHGDNGQGNAQFPRIASQHADYLIKQLSAFRRSANRPDGGVMKTISHDLSGDDIAAVAAYAERLGPK
jgi:cytochrome c553